MDPAAVKDGEKAAEYSQSFGVLLLPHITRDIRPRASTHIPLDMRHRITEYLEKEETAKNERVREFAKAQEEKLDKLRQATMDECSVIAEIINVVNPQSPTIAAARKDSAGASGLAAMLRAGGGGSSVRTGPNPFARPAASGFGMPARLRSNDDDGDIFDLDEDFQTGLPPPESRGRRVTADHQSDEYSEDLEHEENDFGHFGESSGNLSTNPLQQYQAQDVISSRVNVPQQQATASGLGTLMSGSMPQKIPTFGSIGAGGSSFTAGPSLTRREYQMKADEKEMSRRKKEAARGIPKTFVPPHELLDRIHEQDSDLLIGSKPRDSYGWNRKYAPG
ncbi:hypothetical protein GQ54DRAFT_299813 [Martensiomyces pterosporus]|nr:hypothetical protein GQ54DRAFT_299813 [Martensiomyces pterosporus]